MLGGFATNLIVAKAISYHVDTHVGGRLVGVLSINALENGIQHRENLDVAVVVDSRVAVGLKMERVNHVHVAEVGGGSFVGHIDWMLQRKIPNGEGLKFGITRFDTAFVLLVKLAQADSHLAAARTRSGDHNQRTSGLHIVVATKTFVRVNQGDIVRIAFDEAMVVDFDAHAFQTVTVGIRAGLTIIMGNDHCTNHETTTNKGLAQAQYIDIVGNAQVAPNLVFLNVDRADDNDDFSHIRQLHEHFQLAIRLKTRQHTAGVKVIEEFSAKFKVKLVAEFRNPVFDVFRLYFEVFFVVEPVFHLTFHGA